MEDAYADQASQRPPDSVPEVGEDAVTLVQPPAGSPDMTEEEREELQGQLSKVEEEIQTLSQVLASKERQLADIKRTLGITPLNELKQNITKSWQEVTASPAYRRTSETLSQASLKATAAFSSVGSAISKKLEDVRNAPSFKTIGEKVGTLKTKISPPASNSDYGNQDDESPAPDPVHLQSDMPNQEAQIH